MVSIERRHLLARRALDRYAKNNPGGGCFDEGECHSFFPDVGPQTTFDPHPEFNDVEWDEIGYRWERGQRYRNSETRTADTIPQILPGLNPRVDRKSKACSARKLRMSPQILRFTFGVTCSPPTGSGTEHTVKVKVVPKTKHPRFKITSADVKLSCSCPAWVWWGSEWHAKKRKYLDQRLRGDGSAPDVRDPERANMLCKHTYLVFQQIKDWTLTHPAHRRRR